MSRSDYVSSATSCRPVKSPVRCPVSSGTERTTLAGIVPGADDPTAGNPRGLWRHRDCRLGGDRRTGLLAGSLAWPHGTSDDRNSRAGADPGVRPAPRIRPPLPAPARRCRLAGRRRRPGPWTGGLHLHHGADDPRVRARSLAGPRRRQGPRRRRARRPHRQAAGFHVRRVAQRDRARRIDPGREGLLHPCLRRARRLLGGGRGAAGCARTSRRGALGLAGALLRCGVGHVRRLLGPGLHPAGPVPRGQRQHARGRGAAGCRGRDGGLRTPRPGPRNHPPGGDGIRRAAVLADSRALRHRLAAAAGPQPRPARRPLPAVRRHRRARPGVVSAAAASGGVAGGAARVAVPGGRRSLRPSGRGRLGGRRCRRLRLHHRLGRDSRRTGPDALGPGRGGGGGRGLQPADRRPEVRRARCSSGGPTPSDS